MPSFDLSADAAVRLHMLPGTDMPFVAAVARPPLAAELAAIVTARGFVSAMLTHDTGVEWPDATGCALAAAILARGGGVLLGFATLADAMACHARLLRERT